jgi:eukaryotic-like serine/threonine-protein kinase
MQIDSGSRLGPYEILSAVGAGGMGEVWRARDTRLDREVAIKILPSALASNAQFRARFDREAKAISSLNHPNICTLHDVGDEDGVNYLVMELIEGESLASRLLRGPLPLEQVLRFGAQIASGLEAAHRRGVVHRDLKPGNIMLTKSGAKLLDFGLAKSSDPSSILPAGSALATEQKSITEQGTILGTYQYMSPEQLEGAGVDARTDIFALGAVLYEMATGRRAFDGTSRTSLIAAIVSSQPPPISTLAPMTPPALEHVVRKCLEKDPDERWQSAHDVASELRWISEAGSQAGVAIGASRRRDRRKVALAVGILLAGLVAGALGHRWLAPRSDTLPQPFQYVIEHGDMNESRPSVSPDGRSVAYARDGAIHVRDLGRLDPVPIPETQGGSVPFWSPDGRWIGFTADRKLWKVRIDGGGKTLLSSPAPNAIAGGAVWLGDGRIVYTTGSEGLYEVSDRGGDARKLLEPGEGESDFHFISALPQGKGFLFVPHKGDRFNSIELWDGRERKTLLTLEGQLIAALAYAPSGHILFERAPEARGIWALPFSLDRMEATGEPFPLARFAGSPAVEGTTLVYTTSLPLVLSEVAEVDRTGRVVRTIGSPRRGLYPTPAMSPDGRIVAVPVMGESGSDIWIYDTLSGEATRLTFDERSDSVAPAWTPDGTELIYTMTRSTEEYLLRAVSADRSRTRELGRGGGPVAFLDGGKTLLYNHHAKGFDFNLWRKDLADDQPGEAILSEAGNELQPAVSPDGRLLAYSHRGNIMMRTLPGLGGPWQVAAGGSAFAPQWSRDGGRIFYLDGENMMEVPVTTEPSLRIGSPRRLFTFTHAPAIQARDRYFALSPDGETFILIRPVETQPGIVVVQNWQSLIESNR